MNVNMRGRVWKLVRGPIADGNKATCDGPHLKGKKIVLLPSIKDKEELTILIHEFLHACAWDLDEEAIDEISDSIGSALWRMGYRKQ